MTVENGKLYLLLKTEKDGTMYTPRTHELYMTTYDINTKEWKEIGKNGIAHDRKIYMYRIALAVSKNGTPYVFFSDECLNPTSGIGTVKYY